MGEVNYDSVFGWLWVLSLLPLIVGAFVALWNWRHAGGGLRFLAGMSMFFLWLFALDRVRVRFDLFDEWWNPTVNSYPSVIIMSLWVISVWAYTVASVLPVACSLWRRYKHGHTIP